MVFKRSLRIGFSFGLTSGIITTLGMIVGLNAGTSSRLAVIGGIMTIAIADAFSDAMGIHVSQESQIENTQKQIWLSTISTFLTKFFVAMSFVIPVLIFPFNQAIFASVFWGIILLGLFSYFLAKRENKDPISVIGEHVLIATIVIIVTNIVGSLIANYLS